MCLAQSCQRSSSSAWEEYLTPVGAYIFNSPRAVHVYVLSRRVCGYRVGVVPQQGVSSLLCQCKH